LIIYGVKRKTSVVLDCPTVSVGNHFESRAGKLYGLLRSLKIEFVPFPCMKDE